MHDALYYLGLLIAGLVAAQLLTFWIGMVLREWRGAAAYQHERRLWQARLESLRPVTSNQPLRRAWEGWRTFRVARLERLTPDTVSVYLAPEDGRELPPYLPGQYITVSANMPGETRPVVRCYSLSRAWQRDCYRCTVKEVAPPVDRPDLPFGKVSRHFNRRLQAGDLLELKAPGGNFFLSEQSPRPVVLLGAGIGVTPLLSMMYAVAAGSASRRVIALFQFCSGENHPFQEELKTLRARHKNLRAVIAYSAPRAVDQSPRDYDFHGRLSTEIVRKLLPKDDYEFYLCGPGGFMESLVTGLEAAGVPARDIHYEAFGPASVPRPKAKPPIPAETSAEQSERKSLSAEPLTVGFSLTSATANWDGKFASLLELAEANAIPLESGCRAGNCGACAVALQSGKVIYSQPIGAELPAGHCLPCICIPAGPIVLQA